MKCKITYIIRLKTIEDSILKELQEYMKELKILEEFYDLIKIKYDSNLSNEKNDDDLTDIATDFFDYDSKKHKKILNFFYNKGLIFDYNIIKNSFAIIKYDKSDYNNSEYLKLCLNFYQSTISEKCENINNQKIKSINLTKKFIIYDNFENLVCNKDIVKKIQFQEYYTGYATIYFVNKSLGDFLLNNEFTGFLLSPVKKINTDETIFYQLKVTNIIEQPKIETDISSLYDNTEFLYPEKSSILHNSYKKRNDVYIYNQEYITNNFKDFNISYYSFKDSYNNYSNIITRPELIVSKKVMLLLKQHKSKFAMEPIYSTKNIDINTFTLNKEIKELIDKCK